METIYDWLLKNMGNAHVRENEKHNLTLLNVQREVNHAGVWTLDIMARTDDFTILNLLIHPVTEDDSSTIDPTELKGRTLQDSYVFADERQVIAYLVEGKAVGSEDTAGPLGFRVFTLKPANGLGDITFPPSAPAEK